MSVPFPSFSSSFGRHFCTGPTTTAPRHVKCETAIVCATIPRNILLVRLTCAFLRAPERAGSGYRAYALNPGDMKRGVDGELSELRADWPTQLRGERLANMNVHELNPTSG